MVLIRSLIQIIYPILVLNNFIQNFFLKKRTGRLRVIIFHNITKNEESKFQSLLTWLSKRWNFVSPSEFCAMMENKQLIVDDNLLLTFDDGFLSNYFIADRILKPMNIKALFFVVSDFINIVYKKESQEFIKKNILPGISKDSMPDNLVNMKWRELKKLIDAGHTIGAHTKTHQRLNNCNSFILQQEIIESATDIEQRLGVDINHFAFTYGDINSMTSEALKVARDRYKYIYTGIRGDNTKNTPTWAIRRDPINLTDSKWLIGTFLEGFTDKYYNYILKNSRLYDYKKTVS